MYVHFASLSNQMRLLFVLASINFFYIIKNNSKASVSLDIDKQSSNLLTEFSAPKRLIIAHYLQNKAIIKKFRAIHMKKYINTYSIFVIS